MKEDRIAPQDIEAEKAVLGAILLDRSALPVALETLKPDYFYSTAHEKIFAAMLRLHQDGKDVDAVSLRHELKKSKDLEKVGGSPYLNELVSSVVSSANIEAHCQIVAEKYVRRVTITTLSSTLEAAYDESRDTFDIVNEMGASALKLTDAMGMNKTVNPMENVDALIEQVKGLRNFKTGFLDMDKVMRLFPQTIVTVGARPRVGKSIFGLTVADNVAKDRPVLFLSLEMGSVAMNVRTLSKVSGYSAFKLLTNEGIDWDKVAHAANNHYAGRGSRLQFIFQGAMNIQQVRFAVLNHKMVRPDLALVVIDYAQLIGSCKRHDKREGEVVEVVSGIAALAKEADVCIMMLAQLNRMSEARTGDKAPQLSDLGESSILEKASDVVILLHRPELYNRDKVFNGESSAGKMEARIAKNRNGEGKSVLLGFDGGKMRVYDLAKQDEANVKKAFGVSDDTEIQEVPEDLSELPF